MWIGAVGGTAAYSRRRLELPRQSAAGPVAGTGHDKSLLSATGEDEFAAVQRIKIAVPTGGSRSRQTRRAALALRRRWRLSQWLRIFARICRTPRSASHPPPRRACR